MAKHKSTKTAAAKPKAPVARLTNPELVGIDVPVLETQFPIISRVDIALTRRQSYALRAVFDGMQSAGEKVQLTALRDPRGPNDGVRWLLDQVADKLGMP